jgi:MFS family permease
MYFQFSALHQSKQYTPPTSQRWNSIMRAIILLFASTFLSLCGFFMLIPLLVIRMNGMGLGAAEIGAITALVWLGIFAITPWAGRLVQVLGRRRTFVVSAGIPFAAALGFLLTETLWVWGLLLLLDGMASGVRWVLSEATMAELAPPERRGRIVGLFETMVGATFVVGPLILQLTGTEGLTGFAAGAALAGLGFGLTLLLPGLPEMDAAQANSPHTGLRGTWAAMAAAPAVMIAGFVGGFFESGLTGILPLLGLSLGWAAGLATALVAASGLGSSVAMVPVGEAADRFGLRKVSLLCAWLTLAASLSLPLATSQPNLAWGIAFLWGGAGGALYTLAMVNIGHRLQGLALINTTGVLIMAYTAGGIVAPILGGAALQWMPQWGLAALLIAVSVAGVLALWFQRPAQHAQPQTTSRMEAPLY